MTTALAHLTPFYCTRPSGQERRSYMSTAHQGAAERLRCVSPTPQTFSEIEAQQLLKDGQEEPNTDQLHSRADPSPRQTTGKSSRFLEPGSREQKTREVAEDFEAVFVGQMLDVMFKNIPTHGLMRGGTGERIFRAMLLDEYAKQLSKSNSIGIADAVEQQLQKLSSHDEKLIAHYQHQHAQLHKENVASRVATQDLLPLKNGGI